MDGKHIVTDSEGNEIELPMDPKELPAVLETKTKLEADLKQREEELSKLKNKDFNFENLRTKSEAEKKAILDEMDSKTRVLYEEVENLRKEREVEQTRNFSEAKNHMLKELAGEDQELIKQIELAEKDFVGKAETMAQLEERIKKAYTIVKGVRPNISPVHRFSPYSTRVEPINQPKKYTETDQGKANFDRWFPENK